MRHAAKRDDVEPAIVDALEAAGWTVVKVSDKGFPDLACFRRGVVRLLECKGPDGDLTPAQEKTFRRIGAAHVTVHVVRTPTEALLAVAQGVEGVLGPLVIPTRTPCDSCHERPRGIGLSVCEPCAKAIYGGPSRPVVTPAYQKAQTEAVVPKKRRKA